MELILFGSKQCTPCHTIRAKLDSIGVEYEYKDVEDRENGRIAYDFGISAIPTLIVKDGNTTAVYPPPMIHDIVKRIAKKNNVDND